MVKTGRHPKQQFRTVHESISALLGREDLQRLNRLGLWSMFGTVDEVKRFAAQPREQRRAFFDRFERTLAEDTPPKPAADADLRLFDLPDRASLEQIQGRYRELALDFHPDRDGDNELMQEINLAYQRLLERAAGERPGPAR